MKKSLFFLNKFITNLAMSMIFVSLVGLNSIAQTKTEEKSAACVIVDFDGRITTSGPCKVTLTKSNSVTDIDINWDGSTTTQFSMNKFPSDGTYSVEISNGQRVSMKVEKQGKVWIFQSGTGVRGRVIFTD